MPTYGYRCTGCGTEFDVWQRMTDEARADCHTCGRPATRQFFAPAIVFNGSGFYKTDSRAKSGATSGGTKAAKTGTAAETSAAGTSTAGSGGDAPAVAPASNGTTTPSTSATAD